MTPQQIRQAQVLKISEKAQCRNRRGTFMARAPFRHTTFFNIFYLLLTEKNCSNIHTSKQLQHSLDFKVGGGGGGGWRVLSLKGGGGGEGVSCF